MNHMQNIEAMSSHAILSHAIVAKIPTNKPTKKKDLLTATVNNLLKSL